ncbi:MAG: hypothetical protein NTZ48_04705, partial [Candidatus Omnitrophica bacterium]|nr:hypothetical protein [Candidatus Omnitrophota bacterium]
MKNINIVIKKSIMARILSCLLVEIFIITQLFALAPMDRLAAGDTSILEGISLRRIRGAESIDVASEVLGWIDSPIGQYSFYYAILNEGQQQEYRDVVNRVAPLLSSNALFQMRSLEAQALIFWAIWDIGRSRVISPESIAQSLLGAVAEGEAAGDALRSDPAYYTLDPAGRREFEGLAKLSFTERIEDLRVNQEVSLMEGVADVLKAIPLNVMQNIRNTMSAHPLAAGISLDLLITAALTLPFAFGLNWAIGSTGLQAFLTAIAGLSALP